MSLVMLAAVAAPSIAAPAPVAVENVSFLVHVRPGAPLDLAARAATDLGLRIGSSYERIGVFVVVGPAPAVAELRDLSSVAHLEPNAPLELHTDTSHLATRGARLAEGKVAGLKGRGSVDGRGIGIAVVDTGVDGTHPDLVSRMGGNVRIVCTGPGVLIGAHRTCLGAKQAVEVDDSDTPGAGGHGTHVAGTVAGTGETYRGAARGATLYGVGMGTVLLVENALDALEWVLENHDKVSPRIRIATNSWGSGYASPDDPGVSATTKLVNELVKEGVTVVFSAGNAGGTGAAPTTSAQCVNPTPGVICVANYNDGGSGTREGTISNTSSRGATEDPTGWPDISAPGTDITATCRPTLPVCVAFGGTRPPDNYGTMSGTSMAAPHVAGVIAQVLQIAPGLGPAQIEDVIEDSAHRFTYSGGGPYERDPANRSSMSSFDKGHGLIDAVSAARLALRRSRSPEGRGAR